MKAMHRANIHRWNKPTRVKREDMWDPCGTLPVEFPKRTKLKISLRAQVELGLTACDDIPDRANGCCFIPNNDQYMMPLIGHNPCAEEKPINESCCDYEFDASYPERP